MNENGLFSPFILAQQKTLDEVFNLVGLSKTVRNESSSLE